MATADNRQFIIIPMGVEGDILGVMTLALAMAKKSYPHLVEDFEFHIKRFKDEALMFEGSQNIPPKTKKAF